MTQLLKFTRALALGLVLATAAPLAVRAQVVSFSSASDLNQFTLNGSAASTFTFNSTAGVGGGGGLTSTATNFSTDAAIYSTGIANTVGNSFFVSLDYKMQFQSSGPDIRLGFTTSATGNFSGTNDIWTETYGSASPKPWAVNGAASISLPSVAMTAGDWFQLTFSLTETSLNNYSATETVSDLGATGLAAPTVLSTQNNTFTSTVLGGAPQLFPGFYLHNATSAADNFSASSVPEPSAFVSLTLGALSLLGVRRRRSNAAA